MGLLSGLFGDSVKTTSSNTQTNAPNAPITKTDNSKIDRATRQDFTLGGSTVGNVSIRNVDPGAIAAGATAFQTAGDALTEGLTGLVKYGGEQLTLVNQTLKANTESTAKALDIVSETKKALETPQQSLAKTLILAAAAVAGLYFISKAVK